MVKKHLLKVVEIPFGTTTTSLIDSVLAANDKGKIKISKIEDNTAEFVEIDSSAIDCFFGRGTSRTLCLYRLRGASLF